MFDTLFTTLSALPVAQIAESVADHFVNQLIPIVTSDVASGKTLLIPAHCALLLKDDPKDCVVYVLEPTRFLSNNAAEQLREILGKDGENLIGCINSNRSDDESTLHPDNRIIFTTVGYAMSSGILRNKSNFILDEAHETSIDLSLAKAYLYHRREQGDLINLAEMSATIDPQNELDYWGDDAIHFTTEGSAYPVEVLHRPAQTIARSVTELIQDYGRTGILVFVEGQEEIDEAITDIRAHLDHGLKVEYEIIGVHGGSPGDQRRLASRKRTKPIKIVVGTNVLESGISLSWVDGGVSSGNTKVMHVLGNVRKLTREELPRWRVKQQVGRVARFGPGVFILAHAKALELRPEMASPDIVRLPLTELVMHCTSFPDIKIHELQFSPREQPKPGAIEKAIADLTAYGLVQEHNDGHVTLTEDGLRIQKLPISFRAAAAFCEAYAMGKVAEMLPLITMLDIGDIRQRFREPLTGAMWKSSDPVQQVMTLVQTLYSMDRNATFQEKRDFAELHNISLKMFREYDVLLRDLERKLDLQADFRPYLEYIDSDKQKAFERETKQVIFRGMALESYPYAGMLDGVRIKAEDQEGRSFGSAKLSNTTSCTVWGNRPLMCAGNVRIITPKRGFPFAVLESVTLFTEDDVRFLLARFGRPALERVANAASGLFSNDLRLWLEGGLRSSGSGYDSEAHGRASGYTDNRRGIFGDYLEDWVKPEPKASPTPVEPIAGTLGDILSAAMKAKK